MGLTDRRKTAKHLVDSRFFPRFVNFKEGATLTYGMRFFISRVL